MTKKTTEFDMLRDIREFHEKFGLSYDGKPRVLPVEINRFRVRFMREEVDEYEDASDAMHQALSQPGLFGPPPIAEHLERGFDALIDEIYVAIGTLYLHGFTPEMIREGWRRVHKANMAKERATRAEQSKRGTTFDVIKPEGWTAPNHRDLVEDHAHQ